MCTHEASVGLNPSLDGWMFMNEFTLYLRDMSSEITVSRRRFLQATGGAVAVTLAGCSDNPETDGTEPESTETTEATDTPTESTTSGGTTLQLISSSMSTFDPIAATDLASINVILQVFDGLTYYPNGEVVPEPMLVTNYETSEDYRTYTFELKEGVTYHDGKELTAEDVVYSFERLAGSSNSQRSFFILDSIGVEHETDGDGFVPGSLAVESEDEYTVSMTLAEPFHATLPMLAYASFSVLPAGLVDDVEGYDGEMDQSAFATSPVGSGPFVFDHYKSDTEAAVSRFDDYHGQVASLDGVHWQVIEDDEAGYNYAMNKNADIFGLPTAQYVPDRVSVEGTDDHGRDYGTYGPLRNDETANYLAVPTVNTYYIGFNQQNVEKPARQAAAYAMNQQTIVEQVFKGRGAPAHHFTPPSIFPGGADAYTQRAESKYPYGYNQSQLEKARQVMADAGYSQDDPYEFTLTIYESGTWQSLAEILRDQLTSCHVEMTIEQAPFATLLERVKKGSLDAWSLSWWMDWPTPDNFLQLLNPPQTNTSKSDAITGTNWRGTEAAEAARTAWKDVVGNPAPTDEAQSAREEAYMKIENANWKDVVMLPVYHATSERFWYDWVDVPRFGGAGSDRQKFNHTTVGERK